MPNNDLTGTYLNQRENAIFTPAQQLRMSVAPEIDVPDVAGETSVFSPGKIMKDIFSGLIEAPRQVVGGVTDAMSEAIQSAESLQNSLGSESVRQLMEAEGITVEGEGVSQPRSTTGGLIRGVSQFLTGFLPATKALKGVGGVSKAATMGKAMFAGAVTDAFFFDPHEDRFSNLIEKFPVLKNPVTDFLKASPEDTEAEGRFKSAIEGLGLGALTDVFMVTAKGFRANRVRKLEAKAAKGEQKLIEDVAGVDAKAVEKVEKGFKQFDKIDDAPKFKVGKKKAGEERALNINLNKIDTEEDVKDLIEGVGKKFSGDINKARREIITNEETIKLADDLGLTVDDLLKRRKGEAFNAEQAMAARKILVASGENLIEMAKKATTGSDVDVIKFRKAMSTHHAIQSQVSGLTAEAGRALQSFRIQAKSSAEQARMISDILDASGGAEGSKALAKQFSELQGPVQINAFIKQASGATTKAMIYEAWINGLLSSPATHVVNTLSNSLTAAWAVGERKVASLIGSGLDVQSIPSGEATAQIFGMVNGVKDGMRLAYQTLKTGEPSDIITKMEMGGHKALSSENLNLSGNAGRFADFLGATVRTPGRFLTAGDELFKSIGYRMELQSQAFRQATSEGLEGNALAVRINDIISNPPENLHLQSIDAARYQTYTKPLGEAGQAAQAWIKKTPGLRVIVPFIRTPTNIMKYAGERTVLAPLSANVRGEIAAGGARRDMALARIATGSMIMAATSDYVLSGQITGGGPTNPAMRTLLRNTGWQPYSIKVGDDYFSYSRLDPIGATIGIAADLTEIIGQTDDLSALDLASSSVIAVAQNVTSKTYLSGLSQAFDVLSGVSSEPGVNNTKAVRWIERLAGSTVPAAVAQLERTLSPELSATNGIIEKLKSRIPGYSDDLPPRRNIFGEPIVLSGGLGPDIMSPIYKSTDKKDPVADEIAEQKTMLRMPLKSINGVELSTIEYDKYIRLYSGENNRFVKRPLKTALNLLMRSDQYRTATDGQEGGKSLLIRAIFEGYRAAAKQAMVEATPQLARDIRKKKTQKAIKLGAL